MTQLCARRAPVSGETTVSIRVVRALAEVVESAGIPRAALLRAANLEPAQLDTTQIRLPRQQYDRLCEVAIDLTGDPAFGLHWAEALSGTSFFPISQLLTHSITLRKAFETLAQFERVLSDDCGFGLSEHDGRVLVRCRSVEGESPRVQRLRAEMIAIGLFRLIRLFNPGARMARVGFAFARPPYYSEYARVFEQTVDFERPFSGIEFNVSFMQGSSPQRDDDRYNAARSDAERSILRLSQREPYATRVCNLLVQQRAPRRPMKSVARALGLSERSLRRRLVAEGKTYNDIVNDALLILAKRLLREEQRTIQETAFELGFSDPAAFYRAFKRWTGTTPGSYRQQS